MHREGESTVQGESHPNHYTFITSQQTSILCCDIISMTVFLCLDVSAVNRLYSSANILGQISSTVIRAPQILHGQCLFTLHVTA